MTDGTEMSANLGSQEMERKSLQFETPALVSIIPSRPVLTGNKMFLSDGTPKNCVRPDVSLRHSVNIQPGLLLVGRDINNHINFSQHVKQPTMRTNRKA